MSLQFIIGSAGSGKTRYLYDNLIGRSLEEPYSSFIAIVPEQFTMQTQKEIVCLHPAHGTMNIDIVSFNRLAYRVFEELAVEHPAVLDDMGKSMVLRKVASEQRQNLSLYAGHLNQTGFISQMKSMLSELYQYGIHPEDLDRVKNDTKSALLKAKCGDLALIYRAFQKEIKDRFITAEEILDVLCRVLPDSELIRESVITLDGYTGFTPVQYRLLELMMIHAKQVIVTVTADPAAEPYRRGKIQDLFYMGKEMICRLTDLAAKNGVDRDRDVIMNGRFAPAPSIRYVESHLYRYGQAADWEPEEIEILKAQSPAQEIACTADRIHRLVQEEGIRYREIAVITGDLPGYRNEIANRFQAEKIPCFIDDKKSILENAMIEFIRAALEAVRRDFDYESMFRFLKTGLAADDREEMDRLENYCLALGIRGFDRWNETWEYVCRSGRDLNMDRLNEFRAQVLAPLAELRRALRDTDRTVGTMTQAVIRCMEDCRIQEKMEWFREKFEAEGQYSLAREYGQVYDRVMELFDRLRELLGDEKVSLKEYNEILDAGLGEIQLGVIPATVDRVVAGDITRTRLDKIRVLFFVGVNEGIVPGRKDSQSLLTDTDREVFRSYQMELAPTSREDSFIQRYYLYLTLTKPSERLILSCSLYDQAGKSRRPSQLIGELQRMFPRLSAVDMEEQETSAVSVNGGKERLIQGLRTYASGKWKIPEDAEQGVMNSGTSESAEQGMMGSGASEDMKKDTPEAVKKAEDREARRFLELYHWFSDQPEYAKAVRQLTEAAFYSYERKGISKAAARALYGVVLQGSVTRLERYAACAYAHFLSYGLELEERQEYRIQAADMGNLFHSAIDLCFKTAEEQGVSLVNMTDQERNALVRRSVDQVTAEYGNTILQSSARNQYLADRIGRMTERTIWALTEQLRRGDFEPAGFEVAFSAVDNLKAMKIKLSDEEALHLRGRIDRLDLCRDKTHIYVKIIDYKSGSTEFDLAAVYYGLQLQLAVYMDAVMELTERKNPGREVVPAGIFYYHIKDPLVEREQGQTPEDIEEQIFRELKMSGLVNSDMEAIRHLDREIQEKSDMIPVILKDGAVQPSRSSAADSRRFDALRRYVRGKIAQDGREILEGRIQALPHKKGNRTACDYCPYHGVCGFDTRISGYRFRRFPSAEPEQIWAEIIAGKGGAADEMDG